MEMMNFAKSAFAYATEEDEVEESDFAIKVNGLEVKVERGCVGEGRRWGEDEPVVCNRQHPLGIGEWDVVCKEKGGMEWLLLRVGEREWRAERGGEEKMETDWHGLSSKLAHPHSLYYVIIPILFSFSSFFPFLSCHPPASSPWPPSPPLHKTFPVPSSSQALLAWENQLFFNVSSLNTQTALASASLVCTNHSSSSVPDRSSLQIPPATLVQAKSTENTIILSQEITSKISWLAALS